SPRPVQVLETDAGEFCDSDGQYREVNAGYPETKGQKSDKCACQRRKRHCNQQAEPRPDAEMNIKSSSGVSAETNIKCVPQRQLPGKAQHDVPGLAEIGEVQN